MNPAQKMIERLREAPRCGCHRLAFALMKFEHGEQYYCQPCIDEYQTTSAEINKHEMQQFAGAYGLCPVPEILYLKVESANSIPALCDALEIAIEALEKICPDLEIQRAENPRFALSREEGLAYEARTKINSVVERQGE